MTLSILTGLICFLNQDDSYLESYISTIGVDFVSNYFIHYGLVWLLCENQLELILCCIMQKIRTVEQDGKTIKLQIVSLYSMFPYLLSLQDIK